MEHAPYYRVIPGSKNAVLLIHGICGSPAHFESLIPLIPEDWSVYNILLDGHGGTVEDFGKSSMKKWKSQAENMLEKILLAHQRVFAVGHSMGTLFAIQGAIDHPGRISGLFLLAVPLRINMPLSTMLTCLRVAWGNLRPDDAAARAMANDSGIQMTRKLWKYIPWAPRMLELLAECRRVRKILPGLQVRTLAFQSGRDELVSIRTAEDLGQNPAVQTVILEDSGHFAYGPDDQKLLQEAFADFLV